MTLIEALTREARSLLITNEEERRDWTARAGSLPSVQLSPRSLCDLELFGDRCLLPA